MITRVVGKQILSIKISSCKGFERFFDLLNSIVVAMTEDLEGSINTHRYHSYPTITSTANPSKRKVQQGPANLKHDTIWQVASAARLSYIASLPPGKVLYPNNLTARENFLGNPSTEGYETVKEASGMDLALLLSIGSGVGFGRHPIWARGLAHSSSQAQEVHWTMEDIQSTQGLNFYTRFNVEKGPDDIPWDEWKGEHGKETLEYIREKTEKYLDSHGVKEEITEAARFLIETRRARATTDHWEYFCHGVEYVCTMIRCPDSGSIFRKRDELRHHLEDVHRMEASKVETALYQAKRFPLYEAKGADD